MNLSVLIVVPIILFSLNMQVRGATRMAYSRHMLGKSTVYSNAVNGCALSLVNVAINGCGFHRFQSFNECSN